MTVTVGSALGGSAVAATEATYLGTPVFTSARTLTFKTFKPTHNQHPVQGGPYLRNGVLFDLGSARELIWLDALGTLTGDMANSGEALMLACALGTTSTLTQIGTTAAYGLGGTSGASVGDPNTNSTFVDIQTNNPTTDATQRVFTYHSGVIMKSEWVFDRAGLVSKSYDIDFAYVETTTAQATVSEPANIYPFTMVQNVGGTASTFKVGTYGSEALVDGVRKCTITLERKLATERIYLGNQYKDVPVANGLIGFTVALEADYTSAAKTALFDLQLSGTPISIVCTAIGPMIGSSGYASEFSLNVTNAFVNTGGEAPLDGPDIIHNTINLSGTVDLSNDPALKAILITADSAY